jgi:molecular chaperone GrpE
LRRRLQPHPGTEAGTSAEAEVPAEPSANDGGPGERAAPDAPSPGGGHGDEPRTDGDAPPPPPPPSPLELLVASLRDEIRKRDEQLRNYISAYKEAKADMERERERLGRDREKAVDREKMRVAAPLLEVLDNLDRSIAGLGRAEAGEELRRGLDIVRTQFVSALAEIGVERMATQGRLFDARLHEAAALVPAQPGQVDQEIVYEERAGYTLKGQLLRAARVVVASRGQ